ncbi:acyclic terpene utilization AtuA family protein [Pseudomonas sp. NPDC078700]|uniref:acyclic terpene utilization AtuA family protein n=1 Tax=Pseudomonas sp. NPDC078700 TaxID=3364424 RepID=UPI0037C94AE5
MTNIIHIGCGAGFASDRPDATLRLARSLAKRSGKRYLMLELLAERTLAEAQLRKQLDPSSGYATRLFDFLDPILDTCIESGIPIITNGGAANPRAAALKLRTSLAGRHTGLKIACVLGDDLLELGEQNLQQWLAAEDLPGELISVNIYSGADGITQALEQGANIVLCGRVADPSLAVGPVRHGLGWAFDDWQKMAIASTAGHLLECCTQVTGGYFAHPGIKDVPNPANLDCPIIEISADGDLVVTKVEGSSGYVNERTVKEQLLYEIHDPRRYLTPDVILDLGQVSVEQVGENRVKVAGIQGHPRPDTLKGLAGVRGLWFGEASISYAGPGAVARANLARDILLQRFELLGPQLKPWIDLIGVASLFNDSQGKYLNQRLAQSPVVEDVQVRVGIVDQNRQLIEQLQAEVESLYTNGPAGGGGVRRHLSESLTTRDFLIPRSAVETRLEWY